MGLLLAQSAWAEGREETRSRRVWGVALYTGSAILLKKSWDFHQQADESYALYRKADTGPRAELYFDRAGNRDTKSQMSWMAAAAFALAGWQMLASGDEEEREVKKLKMARVEIEPELAWQGRRVGLQFTRRFF